MWADIIDAVTVLTGLGLTFAAILALANKKLKVFEDPRIDEVEEMLPGTNCGACGEPGCRAFSEALVSQQTKPGKCTVSSADKIDEIAEYLGVDAGKEEKRVARLPCAGGRMEDREKIAYQGNQSCRGLSVVGGGNRGCSWGCLGLGDCEDACTFDAISMNANGLPVVDIDACTACEDCVEICPLDLFTIMPISRQLIVQCKSELEGETATMICSVACDACGRCALDSAPGLIEMRNNLPVIDYTRNSETSPEATWRCPTGAIEWIEGRQHQPASPPVFPLGRVEVVMHEKSEA